MSQTDFERFVAACDYPGQLNVPEVEHGLATYLKALGVDREIIRIVPGWSIYDYPGLFRYGLQILDEFAQRTGRRPTRAAREALTARDALAARDALDARAAREALTAREALAARDARDARDALDARAARDALDALAALAVRDALAALAVRDALIALAVRDALIALAARDARAARDALAALQRFCSWCVQTTGWYWWRFDLSWIATTYFGAVQNRSAKVITWSKPVLDAFVSGAWMLHWTKDTLFWVAKPTVHTELVRGGKRLHNSDYAAIESDVENLYFWHGVLVPAFVVVRPEWITLKHIDQEQNAEVRRVLIERYGQARYLADSGAKVIDRVAEDDTRVPFGVRGARLLYRDIPGDEPLVMVELHNSTPEPDGQRKTYSIRVPPDVRSCIAAVAWTCGKTESDYAPAVET